MRKKRSRQLIFCSCLRLCVGVKKEKNFQISADKDFCKLFSLFFLIFVVEASGAFQELFSLPGIFSLSAFQGCVLYLPLALSSLTFFSADILLSNFPNFFTGSSITSIYLVIQPFPPLNLTSRSLIHRH